MRTAAEHAIKLYQGFGERSAAAQATYKELKRRLDVELGDEGVEPSQVIDELVANCEDGLVLSGGPRFFGWVIGGSTPAAIAADWLVAALDQNTGIYQCTPASAVTEEVAGKWLKELLRLPEEASFGMVTGCQMAHFTCLAAARHRLLAQRGIDVNEDGLAGAPTFRVLTGEHRHETLTRALRFLGIGRKSIELISLDDDGRMDMTALEQALASGDERPTIVSLMAGDLNTGAADPFTQACKLAHARGAWVHVDGAFGLWVNASAQHRHMLSGIEQCDSWATDGHKWLQLPYDQGFAFVRDAEAHRSAMGMTAGYFIKADGDGRDAVFWNPEWSRRPRGMIAYAALRALGRRGVEHIVDTCCRLCARLVDEIGALDGAEVLAPGRMNQGLVRFLSEDGDHDTRTDEVCARLRAEGTAWFGSTEWRGQRVMRISVCNFRTTDHDVDLSVDAVRRVLRALT